MYVNNAEVWSLRFYTSFGDQVAINVFNYKVGATGVDLVTDLEAVQALSTHFATAFRACISSAAKLEGFGLQRRIPSPPGHEALTSADSGVGQVAGEPLPRQVAGLISTKTEFAGPRYRGRFYIPFPGESDNDTDATPTAAAWARFNTLADKLEVNVTVTGTGGNVLMIPVVYSRKFQTTNQVLQAFARDNWATQQRRGAFGPKNVHPF